MRPKGKRIEWTIGTGILMLVIAFGHGKAQAVEPRPSPDGRFNNCVARADLVQAIQNFGHRGIASWDAHQRRPGKNETWLLREILSISVKGDNGDKRWIIWTGWDSNEHQNGKEPSLFCAQDAGKGIFVPSSEMQNIPNRPFGHDYRVPSVPYMGSGQIFIYDDARGKVSGEHVPNILLNKGEGRFRALYVDPTGHVMGSETTTSGATRDTILGSNFKFPAREELRDLPAPPPPARM